MTAILSKASGVGRKVAVLASLAMVASMAAAQSAFAQTTQDYSAVTDSAGDEIAAALPIALGVVGIFVGVMIAYKVLRRVIRA